MPERDANGKYLMLPTRINKKKDFWIPQLEPMAKKATPKAIEGIK